MFQGNAEVTTNTGKFPGICGQKQTKRQQTSEKYTANVPVALQ